MFRLLSTNVDHREIATQAILPGNSVNKLALRRSPDSLIRPLEIPGTKLSRQLINEYRADLDRLRAVSGSRRESVLREAFKDLLKRWGRAHDLQFIPEHDIVTPQKNRIYLDGALLHALRVPFGYWEAKDVDDDLDKEIEAKSRKGYRRQPTESDGLMQVSNNVAMTRTKGKSSTANPLGITGIGRGGRITPCCRGAGLRRRFWSVTSPSLSGYAVIETGTARTNTVDNIRTIRHYCSSLSPPPSAGKRDDRGFIHSRIGIDLEKINSCK